MPNITMTIKLSESEPVDVLKDVPKWQIATPEQEREANLFLEQSEKWGPPWV